MRDHKSEPVNTFNGLFDRGDPELTPKDHFQGSNNIKHIGKTVLTRDAINISQDVAAVTPLTNIRRLYNYPTLTKNTRLVLSYDPATNTGKVYHVVDSGTQFGPVLTIVGMTDIAFVPFGGRAYISPFASLPPTLEPPVAALIASATAGVGIDAGVHKYATTFVTAVGETTASPLTTVTAQAAIADPATTPLLTQTLLAPGQNSLVAGATYKWRFTYSTDNNITETNVGTASAGLVVTGTDYIIKLFTDIAFPGTANLKVNIYRTLANGASYFREFSIKNTTDIGVTVAAAVYVQAGLMSDAVLALQPAAPSANNTSALRFNLSGIPIGSPSANVISRKIYRTAAGLDQLKLLTTLADNVTTVFADSAADATLGANVPTVNTVIINGDNIEKGLAGEFLYVYAGDGTNARKAAGVGLNGVMTIAAGAVGNIDAGLHVYGVVSETRSGYLSPPSALGTFINVAGHSVSFGNIPVSGDPNVVARHIVSSIKIDVSAANPLSSNLEIYELFFIPDATISNNVDRFLNNVSFFDADLIDNASDLADNYTEIPAGAFLSLYHSRLILGATYLDPNLVLVSQQGEPEAISQIDGLLSNSPNGFPVSNAAEFRDVLYVMRPNSTMSAIDNGDVPSAWPIVDLESGLGARPHAVCQFLNSATQSIEYLIVATYQGVSLFTGGYQSPELSWKIENLWKRFNRSDFNMIQIVNNIVKKRIYIVVPDRYLLVGFFQNGLNPKDIQWEQWTFDQPINTICVTDIDEDILGSDIF